jgi:hypothetical protein
LEAKERNALFPRVAAAMDHVVDITENVSLDTPSSRRANAWRISRFGE